MERNGNFKPLPAAIVMIVADKRVPLNLESAQYALYNIDPYAQVKGLGCRNLVGNQMFLNRSRSFRKLVGLKKHEKIFGTLALGYPAVNLDKSSRDIHKSIRNPYLQVKLSIMKNSGNKLVTLAVFDNVFDVRFNLLKDMLDEAGISYITDNEFSRTVKPALFMTPDNISIAIKVYEDRLEEARTILDSIK